MEINARRIQTIAEETGFIRDNLEKVMRLKGKAVIGCTFLCQSSVLSSS